MNQLLVWQWLLGGATALLVGFSKAGVPALGTLLAPLFAHVLPARASTGALLPLLIAGDIFVVIAYHQHAVWRHLVRLLPWALAGIVLGYIAMGHINDRQMRPILGGLVIVMLAISLWRDLARERARAVRGPDAAEPPLPTQWWFAAIAGLIAGATTMVANAAGPIMMIYLLSMRLPKNEFLGTSAWYFFILNVVKVPFSLSLGLITVPSLTLDAILVPLVIGGAVAGLFVARRLPEKAFTYSVYGLSFIAGVLLFF
jgi:uncharacterized protein